MVQLTWLVTGCSSGLGEELVYEIIVRGDRVVATARRAKERLGKLEAAGAFVLDLNITWPQQQIDDTIRQAIDVYGRIDVLVNNAGYLEAGLVEEVRYVDLAWQAAGSPMWTWLAYWSVATQSREASRAVQHKSIRCYKRNSLCSSTLQAAKSRQNSLHWLFGWIYRHRGRNCLLHDQVCT